MPQNIETVTQAEIEAELAEHQARILRAKIEIEESKKRLKELNPYKAKRSSRILRSENPKPILINEKKLQILEILYYHRLATTEIFQAVIEGNDDWTARSLKNLWDAGYIDRPKVQWILHQIYNEGKGRSVNIYALANKGMKVLKTKRDFKMVNTDLSRANKEIGESKIYHDVMLTKLWACLKAGLEHKRKRTRRQYNLIEWQQDSPDREKLKTEIKISFHKSKIIIPDAAFILQCPQSRYLFFVEYYRTKKGGHQNYLDKLKLYNLYYKQKKFHKYGIKKGFKVITIVPSEQKRDNLISLIANKKENQSLRSYGFWFVSEEDFCLYQKERKNKTTFKKIADFESILKPIFRTAVDDRWHRLEE